MARLRAQLIGCGEVRHLIGMGLLERGALGDPRYVGFGRRPLSEGTNLWHAQDIGHQQVGDREAAGGQPFALGQDPFNVVEAAFEPTMPWQIVYAIGCSLAWILLLYLASRLAFRRWIIEC